MSLASSDAPEKTTGPPTEAAIESVTATGHVSEPPTGGATHIGRFCSAAGGSTVCARPTPDADTTAYTSMLVTATFRPAGAHARRRCNFIVRSSSTRHRSADDRVGLLHGRAVPRTTTRRRSERLGRT